MDAAGPPLSGRSLRKRSGNQEGEGCQLVFQDLFHVPTRSMDFRRVPRRDRAEEDIPELSVDGEIVEEAESVADWGRGAQ